VAAVRPRRAGPVGRSTTRTGADAVPVARPPAPAGSVRLLERAATELSLSAASTDPAERFVTAHLAALRAGAAVVTARQLVGGRRRGPVNVWESLLALAPELEDWALFFGAAADRRAAVDSGRGPAVEAAEADAHLAQAEAFTGRVAALLDVRVWLGGLPLAAS
jgi:hypothetical protein